MANTSQPLQISKEDIGKQSSFFIGRITELNSERITIQRAQTKQTTLILYAAGILTMLSGIGSFCLVSYVLENNEHLVQAVMVILLTLGIAGGVLLCRLAWVRSRQQVIFSRRSGTITLPKHAFSAKHISIYYKSKQIYTSKIKTIELEGKRKKKFEYASSGIVTCSSSILKLFGANVVDVFFLHAERVQLSTFSEFWSYMDTYMGGELPAGTAFDKYR